MQACETDYDLMSGWFGSTGVTGMKVQVTPRSNGAHWFGGSGSSTVRLYLGGASYTDDPVYLRYLMVSEITEIFMMNQNAGWFQGGDEGSKGEGLSRFLGARFLDVNGFAELPLRTDYGTARLWLNSPRGDYVNNAPDDNGYDAVNGCTALFIWYLVTQFGFSETQIVAAAASTLAGVYRNLTGDSGDPFSFFKNLLDFYYPSTTSSAIAGPNPDNPWPLTFASFWVDKSTFGRDEVTDAATPPNSGSFPNSLWLVVDGLNRQVLGAATPTLSGSATAFHHMTVPPDPAGAEYEFPAQPLLPQRVRFPYDVDFTAGDLAFFPAPGAAPITLELDGAFTLGGNTARAGTVLELAGGADPYFTNVSPALGNVSYLSQDLRVFTERAPLTAITAGQGVLTDADRRGLTPVFHTNMTPYGEIQLNLDKRLALSAIDTPQPPAGSQRTDSRSCPTAGQGLSVDAGMPGTGVPAVAGRTCLRQANAGGSLIAAGIGSQAWRRGLFRLR